jgi:hypothetical protein
MTSWGTFTHCRIEARHDLKRPAVFQFTMRMLTTVGPVIPATFASNGSCGKCLKIGILRGLFTVISTGSVLLRVDKTTGEGLLYPWPPRAAVEKDRRDSSLLRRG